MKTRILVEKDVVVQMRDGVRLFADIYRPDTDEPLPVLLQRTPYGKQFAKTAFMLMAAERGYGVICQDTRGRWASEGEDYPLFHEEQDGFDTLEWAAHLPWANGKIGMFGGSYGGFVQWAAARSKHPALKTIIPAIASTGLGAQLLRARDGVSLGRWVSWAVLAGVQMLVLKCREEERRQKLLRQFIELSNAVSDRSIFYHLPVEEIPVVGKGGSLPFFADALEHLDDEAFWAPVSFSPDDIDIPVMQIAGWYDFSAADSLRDFSALATKQAITADPCFHKIIVGPWLHGQPSSFVGEVDFGMESSPMIVLPELKMLDWFDYWLKNKSGRIAEKSSVDIFVMGKNEWREENVWPPERSTPKRYYLHSGGKANTRFGDGVLSLAQPEQETADTFVYDPADPVPVKGGALCCWFNFPAGAYDQRAIEERPDVLVYSTSPLKENIEITGEVSVVLSVASSAVSTDFTAKLVDVAPDGFARNLLDGIVRLRWEREGNRDDKNQVKQCRIDLGATSNVFMAGHCIRLEISSSSFPQYDRNPNTGENPVKAIRFVKAEQRLFHDAEHPSYVVLPVISEDISGRRTQ